MFEMRQLCYSMIEKVIPERKASQQSPLQDATQSSIFLASGFSAPKHYPRPLHRLSRAPLGGTGKVLDLPFLDGDVAHRDNRRNYYDRRKRG